VGTFAETAIVDYRLSFAVPGKQTCVFRFRLKRTNGSLPFLFPFAVNKWKLSFSISPFSVFSWVSKEVDFRNYAAVGIFSELCCTSAEFDENPCAKFRGIP
jgi:hypothetical protein